MLFNEPKLQHIHFIGIGGIGMCGLAEVLLSQGCHISGSDEVDNTITQRLTSLGAQITQGHAPLQTIKADVVVYSSAIPENNPELMIAREQGMLLWRRGELLAKLMGKTHGIAIAGTHGKTTTTGMISHILADTSYDPIAINGGIVQGGQSTVRMGQGDYLVAEADESDLSFLLLYPEIAIITNIEADHLENYSGDFNQLKQSFMAFANRVPAHGLLVCGIDDAVVRSMIGEFTANVVTFGFSADADVRADQYTPQGLCSHFSVQTPEFTSVPWTLNLPGKHNVLNALAAIAVGRHLRIDESTMREKLPSFPGMGRRFHFCGQLPVTSGHALIYTDYGHHPSEIAATLSAARDAWPSRRIIMVFQPHRYSRTQALLSSFVQVLKEADIVILLDIYAASEQPIAGLSSETLLHLLQESQAKVHYFPELQQLPQVLKQIACADDVIFLQGAGNIGSQVVELLRAEFD